MRIVLSGSAGFVGAHALHYLLNETDHDVVCLVSFEHMGSSARLRTVQQGYPGPAVGLRPIEDRLRIIRHDLRTPIDAITREQIGAIDVIWNIASESHVDRSIAYPVPFIKNNVDLILNMMEYARVAKPRLFLQMSTDEVYGPAPTGHNHVEWETPLPSNPYSASKAAQEAIAFSYWRTYGVPVVITNTMNIVGEMQDQEKMVPMTMTHINNGTEMTIHASAEGVIGSRYYLHAYNLAHAWGFLTEVYTLNAERVPAYGDGTDRPAKFHIVGEQEVDNLELAQIIASEMGKPLKHKLVDFHSSRPGHDLRYALDGTKIQQLGWKPPLTFEQGIRRTVRWTLDNPAWMR